MQNEHLDVHYEPENPVDKYAVCVLKVKDAVGHLKKGDAGRCVKAIFYFPRSHAETKCVTSKVAGKMVQSWRWTRIKCFL